MQNIYEYLKQEERKEVEENAMKLYKQFREEEQNRLEEKVRNMSPETRERYLMRVASYYLAMDRYCKFMYDKWRDR